MSEKNNIWAGHLVRLRAVTGDDWENYFKEISDTESARYGDDIKIPISPVSLRERIEKRSKANDHNISLAIETIKNVGLVGPINVHGADTRHRCFEYGIGIFRDQRKNGYAAEAVALLLRYYFRELGYNRAWATVYEFNEPSLALHRALGFVEEGCLRKSMFTNGCFYDEHIFSMLESEFSDLEKTLPPVPFISN